MCGISGIISLDGSPIKSLQKRLELMTQSLHHRGPDQSGIYYSQKKNFGLSNNRLSIVAPKEDVALPFTKDKKNYLSFNGEIYNYEEIRDFLKKNYITFHTGTDTEVLYEFLNKFKNENLDKLNGMWSFAYYNEEKHELLLSRDLLGERHLFYIIEENELIFCSEPKPIIMASLKKHELDFESIITSWKFNSCAPGKTLVKNLNRLKPGNNLIFKDKNIHFKKFQKLRLDKWLDFFDKKPSVSKIDEEFEKLLHYEVNLRLPKEVVFSTPLSGGIDSAILVNVIKKTIKNLKTFYAISNKGQEQLKDKDRNEMTEVSFSKYLSKKLKTAHETVKINNDFSVNELKDASKNCFDGCVDFGVVNYSMVSKYVHNKSGKVIMFAEGPDELLGGYHADIDANNIDNIFFKRKYLLFFLKSKLVKKLVIKLLKLKKNIEFEFNYDPFYTRVNHLVCPNQFLDTIVKKLDLNKFYDYGVIDQDYKDISIKLDNSQKRALIYATKTLPDMFNLRTDKGFMKYSVEARLPFQAISLVEFFIAMPSKYRFKKDLGKYFLRKYADKNIDKFVSKAPKHGMGTALWEEEENKKILNMKETIRQTNFFGFFPFKKNVKEVLLNKDTHPANLWTSYALINTFNELNKINEKKLF
jgi:asparagine synthase (glutamine-hydrolysing)